MRSTQRSESGSSGLNGPEASSDRAAAVLADLPMLRALPEDARRLVVESFEPESFAFGSSIVEEGEEGDALYVVTSGAARVLKRKEDGSEVSVETLGPGDTFGEIALIEGRPDSDRARKQRRPGAQARRDLPGRRAVNPEIKEHFERHVDRVRLRDLFRLSSTLSRSDPETLDALIDALEP